MKKYLVTYPIAGYCSAEVELDDNATEEEIYDAAIDQFSTKSLEDLIEDFQYMEEYNSGNVCYISGPWERSIEEIKDKDSQSLIDTVVL